MSTPDSPYPPGEQAPYRLGPYQQAQHQQAPYAYGQYPQAGPYSAMPQGPYRQPGSGVPAGPAGYLRGGPVGLGDAVKLAFRHVSNYRGRASRSAYWWFFPFVILTGLLVDIPSVLLAGITGASAAYYIPIALFSIGSQVVLIPLGVRRLHDIDWSGYWLLLGLFPPGLLVLFAFAMIEGTRGPNRFGG